MTDIDIERFEVRSLTRWEADRQIDHAKNMLFAAVASSLAILGAAAFFITVMF